MIVFLFTPFVTQVNQQRQKLHDLQNLIDNLGSQDTVSDKAFEDRLKEAEKTIMDLLNEAEASKGTGLFHALFYVTFQPASLCSYVYPAACHRGGQRPFRSP